MLKANIWSLWRRSVICFPEKKWFLSKRICQDEPEKKKMMENRKNKVKVKEVKKPYKGRGGDCKLKLHENGRNNMQEGVQTDETCNI